MSTLARLKETVAAASAAERGGETAVLPPVPRPPGAAAAPAQAQAPAPVGVPPAEMVRRRDDAARRLAEAHWDLGGLAYEMAIRDHFRMDVLLRQAAMVQELDAELSQLERLIRLEQSGATGTCPSCDTPYGRGAAFCSTCGTQLVDTVTAQ
jgi:hypothetical protein